jgi:2-polyprenyl-3-methyl-5-hydroxy-6-metoxy-1,4-benzoquinol methylase
VQKVKRLEKAMDFNSIDWNAMWQAESKSTHWKDTKAQKERWDKRADLFDKRTEDTDSGKAMDKDDYISKMLVRVEVKPEWTVLDIGCGPGTLAIALAQKARGVTALDISPRMLKRLKDKADTYGLDNIQYLNSSWQDAFTNGTIASHDVVLASRSLMSDDIQSVLTSIIALAREAAYLTLPVVNLPFDWEVYQAIGRDTHKHAPYIYILNLLYQMGIHANVEILYSKVKMQFSSVEEAVSDLQWRTDPFTPDEKATLVKYLAKRFAEQKDSPVFTHEGRSQWALIWWRKENRISSKSGMYGIR